jgi:methylmalonyl-CoA/ethylmalonyl-CoA epimerase
VFEAIDRIVVAVKDLDKAKEFFSDLLEIDFDEPLIDEEFDMRAVYSLLGLELVDSTAPGSVIDKYVQAKGEGVFRVVIKVSNMDEAVKRFEDKGVRAVGELTIGGLREVAFHPKDLYGIQIVLAEYKARHPATIAALEKN